jgi:hypothetical protein
VARTLLFPGIGITPLATAGLTEPKPVAASVTVDPGAAATTTVLAADGKITPCAENKPKSDVATPITKGALVEIPTVTVILTDGTPAAISNGTCTFSCVGLTYRIGAERPPILTEVPATVSGADGGNASCTAPFVRFVP